MEKIVLEPTPLTRWTASSALYRNTGHDAQIYILNNIAGLETAPIRPKASSAVWMSFSPSSTESEVKKPEVIMNTHMWITGMILHIWAGIDSSSSLTVVGHGFASFSSDLLHHFISSCWAPATSFNISSQIIDCEEQRVNRESRLTWTESVTRSERLTDHSGSSLTERQRIFPPQTCKTHDYHNYLSDLWISALSKLNHTIMNAESLTLICCLYFDRHRNAAKQVLKKAFKLNIMSKIMHFNKYKTSTLMPQQ